MRYLFQKKKKYIFLKKRNSCFQKIFHSQKGTILCFFDKNNISLYFIKTNNIRYKQFNANFIPSLSIIDLLMFNSIEDVHQLLNEYTLI